MAFDDPIVWILIIAVVVFLFGANKIPALARSLGQARKEFSEASNAAMNEPTPQPQQAAVVQQPPPMTQQMVPPPRNMVGDDPLVVAAQKEGIDTQGKTREQIASELSWKLNKK